MCVRENVQFPSVPEYVYRESKHDNFFAISTKMHSVTYIPFMAVVVGIGPLHFSDQSYANVVVCVYRPEYEDVGNAGDCSSHAVHSHQRSWTFQAYFPVVTQCTVFSCYLVSSFSLCDPSVCLSVPFP